MKSVSKISREFNKRGWLLRAASAAALAFSLGLTACSHDYTLAWVYAPSASLTSGLINAYKVDFQNGQLSLLPDSPIPSGGRKPSGLVATPTGLPIPTIFVINHDDSNVVSFLVGSDGKLYPQQTVDTTNGSFPTSVAISPDGNFLYVAFTYQLGYTTASPGPGGIDIFPIISDTTHKIRSLGTPVTLPIGRAPVGIAVGNGGKTVYVVAQDAAAKNPSASLPSDQTLNLFAFATNTATGALTPIAGETIVSANSPSSGFATGASPASVISDAAGTHLYVTDATGNIVISYAIDATTGTPGLIAGGSAATGSGPGGMTFTPNGSLFFVANYDGSISGYTIGSNGAPVPSTTAGNTNAGTGTTCVTVEPTRGIYLYASGSLSNTMVGEEIQSNGALKPIFKSPYEASTLPICAITVANPTAGD